MGWVLSQVDDRLSDLLRAYRRLDEFAYFNPNEAWFALVDRLAFAERITYWTAGLRTFSRFPLLGVGPGNSGFFFEQHLPAFSYQLTEIKNVLNLASFGFPNPKNLWFRLLAEGGILGFASFMTWFMLTGIGAFMLWRHRGGYPAFIGLAGVIGAVAFIFEGFSMDTYALPQTWILFGLTAAVLRNSEEAQR
jgi:O-antigen ligase